MKKRTLMAGGALLGATLLLTSCAGGGSGSDHGSAARSDINVVSPAQPTMLDPHLSGDAIMAEVTRPIFETLVSVDENLEVQPVLAESFERSDDGLSYTFKIREGLTFQDGSELDTTDVVDSMERWTRLTAAGQENFPGATWTAIDDSTVELKVTTPSFQHLLQLSSRLNNYPAILPSEVIADAGDDPITAYIGTGPYTFEEWEADQYISLKKWNDYVPGPGETSGLVGDKTGTLTDITFNFVSDPSTRSLGLQSGQYDIATEVPYDGLEQITSDPNLQVGAYLYSPQLLLFSTGNANSFSSNVDFRQAINTALERDSIMTAAVGQADLYDLTHHQMVRAQEALWNTEVGLENWNTGDVEKAQDLLAQAGYNGETIKLVVTRDYSEAYNAAVVVQAQLKDLGMNVELEALEWSAYSELYLENWDAWDIAVHPTISWPEPSQTIGFAPERPGYIQSERLTNLLADYRAVPTLDEARTFYDEMQQYIEDLRPVSQLGDAHNVYAATTALGEIPVFDSTIVWWKVQYAS